MNILVLFTCYNRKEKTIRCINSLVKNNSCNIQFLILDDNSTDGTKEALEKFDNAIVIEGDGNSFYSGGMRKIIAKAKKMDLTKYDYVMIINDDVLFYPNIVEKMVMLSKQNKGVIVGATCDSNGNLSYGGVIKTRKIKPEFKAVISSNEKLVKCDTFCANCVLIPIYIFIKVDNIDNKYKHAMGDFDYGFSIIKEGYNIYASNFYVGICNDNPVKGTWRDTSLPRKIRFRKKESVKGLPFKEYFYYLNKNHGFITAVIYSITPYVRILLKK